MRLLKQNKLAILQEKTRLAKFTTSTRQKRCWESKIWVPLILGFILVTPVIALDPQPGSHYAAAPPFGRILEFEIPEFYPPPNENRIKSIIRGGQAEPKNDGLFWIQQPTIVLISLTGETNLVAQASECYYDLSRRCAWSTSWIIAQIGDGKVIIRGEGFTWKQDEAVLTITNSVNAKIRF
jgi:hypothetical protein